MLSPIFHELSGNVWNINQILEQDVDSDKDITNDDANNYDINHNPEIEIFDDDEENLLISECF